MLQLFLFILMLTSGVVVGHIDELGANSKPPTQELPRPLTVPRELTVSQDLNKRNSRSRRPTLMDVALQQSVQQGLNAMADLYGRIQPQMILNGVELDISLLSTIFAERYFFLFCHF